MGKEKKITVVYFLNKSVKPKIENNKTLYPLYLRITYNRVSTKVKVLGVNGNEVLLEEKYDLLEYSDLEVLLKSSYNFFYCDPAMISKIIQKEISFFKDRFTLKGFGKTIGYYSFAPVQSVLLRGSLFVETRKKEYLEKQLMKLDVDQNDLLDWIDGMFLSFNGPRVDFYLINKLLDGKYASEMPEEIRIPELALLSVMHFLSTDKIKGMKNFNRGDCRVYMWMFTDLPLRYRKFFLSKILDKSFLNERESIKDPILSLSPKESDIDKCIKYVNNLLYISSMRLETEFLLF